MVRGMQDPPPENPDSLPFHIEERTLLHPPIVVLLRQVGQSRSRQVDQPRRECLRSVRCGKQYRRIRLRTTEEIPEESPLRQKLVPEYFERRTRTGMRPERKIRHCKLPEHRSCFVDFARISLERMLQE